MKLLHSAVVALALIAPDSGQDPNAPLVFVADMQGRFVAPAAVDTAATAKATGVLVGNVFTVHGSFSGLSSPLRDLEKKPDDPGVHLHRGAPGLTTPYFHGLQVKLDAGGRSGIFYGKATLTAEQLQSLLATEAYVDIHTVTFGPGEVRDQWRALDKAEAARRLAGLGAAASVEPGSCHPAK